MTYLPEIIRNYFNNYLQRVSINTKEEIYKPIDNEEEPNSYDNECPVCYRNQDEDDLQLIDCNNHIACCEDCWKKLRENKCPICRESIKKTPPVDINMHLPVVNTISPTVEQSRSVEQHYFREGSYLHVLCNHHNLNTEQRLYFSHSTTHFYIFKNERFEIRKKKEWWSRLLTSNRVYGGHRLFIGKSIPHRHYRSINILYISRS